MPELRQYELVYVIAPNVGDDAVDALHAEVDEIVSGVGGRIEQTDNWGSRRLAYEIGKHREGTYVVALIEGPGEVVDELERKLKVRENILRYLVVRVDEDLKKAKRVRERRQKQQRRRSKQGPAPMPTSESTPELEGANGPSANGSMDAIPTEDSKTAELSEAEEKE